MQKINIANTDIDVSILGLGTVKLGRNTAVKYPTTFDIPDDKTALNLLNTAAECGINLLDTAPAYGNSEARLGELIKYTSHEWVISTKVGEEFDAATGKSTYNFSPEHIQASIENSLRQLQRDYLDIVLIHSNGDDEKIIQHYGALDTLNRLKQKGLIRATGMSTKTIAGGILTAKYADIVMVAHSLTYQKDISVIEHAEQQHKSIFIKKAFDSGHNTLKSPEKNIRKTFDHIYKNLGVSSIILGSINPEHIKNNAISAKKSYGKSLRKNKK
jgi:aryl-alcohol dehydrogenase-like predicted oxidoreductase